MLESWTEISSLKGEKMQGLNEGVHVQRARAGEELVSLFSQDYNSVETKRREKACLGSNSYGNGGRR